MATIEYKEKKRWGELSKVYTRKRNKKRFKSCDKVDCEAAVSTETVTDITNNQEKVDSEKLHANPPQLPSPSQDAEDGNSFRLHEQQNSSPFNVASDDLSNENQPQEVAHSMNQPREVANGNGLFKPIVVRVHDRVRINISAASSRDDILELRKNLVKELDCVRSLSKELCAKQVELSGVYSSVGSAYTSYQHSENNAIQRTELLKANSEVASVPRSMIRPSYPGNLLLPENNSFVSVTDNNYFAGRSQFMGVNSELESVITVQEHRPFRQLHVSVKGNYNQGPVFSEHLEKEKRTPKANQYYHNSDFLLAKDRLPPETNRKVKSNSRRKHGQVDYASSMDRYWNQVFKKCSNLLQRLMKHKHGWVFNEPVNTTLLGLHDYHVIIKHPMDLGTIKHRLANYLYKSPREFAEDVRLTFHNAKTYNPKGHDVHTMAELLSNIFEEKWAVIEAEFDPGWSHDTSYYCEQPAPMSTMMVPSPPHSLPILPTRNLDMSEYTAAPVGFRPKPSLSRIPAPKKPKAKDINKRDMTIEEKRKLSTSLEGLPMEKLESIVQIMNKRSSVLKQHGDEIELDIDSVDTETLWELDRFVTNYKKSLSKYRRRAELAQARAQAQKSIPAPNLDPAYRFAAKENKADEMEVATDSIVQERQKDDVSSSSSSSTSDSDSSSSDSDSDSSSAQGSDGN